MPATQQFTDAQKDTLRTALGDYDVKMMEAAHEALKREDAAGLELALDERVRVRAILDEVA